MPGRQLATGNWQRISNIKRQQKRRQKAIQSHHVVYTLIESEKQTMFTALTMETIIAPIDQSMR